MADGLNNTAVEQIFADSIYGTKSPRDRPEHGDIGMATARAVSLLRECKVNCEGTLLEACALANLGVVYTVQGFCPQAAASFAESSQSCSKFMSPG